MLQIYTYTPRESFGSNTYLIESGGIYAVIDPSVDFETVSREHPEVKSNTRFIIVTHAHFDHILAIDSWVDATHAEVLVGRSDASALSDSSINAYKLFFGLERGYYGEKTPVDPDDVFALGDETFKVIATPGHTAGGISLLFDGVIFVGDTVFADGAYGRYDLPGGDLDALMCSIRYLAGLDRTIKVYSGHGRPTDINEIHSYFTII